MTLPSSAFVNIHAHGPQTGTEIRITNVDDLDAPPTGHISVGIHPWTLSEENRNEKLSRLQAFLAQCPILAIGECGLDLLAKASLPLQQAVFEEQIRIAWEWDKPLIIHCVKAHNELIRLWKSARVKVPAIVHGFDSKPEIARQLLSHGFHLSFGKALLNPGSNACRVIAFCPPQRLFLETDDCDIAIQTFYSLAAKSRNVRIETLQECIMANFASLFDLRSINGSQALTPRRPHCRL
ncbi:MAG: TatD family hydrolase [Methylococcaceae bacterium]|nr:TatD family hydrolase [Methylococcaceae bacterium]